MLIQGHQASFWLTNRQKCLEFNTQDPTPYSGAAWPQHFCPFPCVHLFLSLATLSHRCVKTTPLFTSCFSLHQLAVPGWHSAPSPPSGRAFYHSLTHWRHQTRTYRNEEPSSPHSSTGTTVMMSRTDTALTTWQHSWPNCKLLIWSEISQLIDQKIAGNANSWNQNASRKTASRVKDRSC